MPNSAFFLLKGNTLVQSQDEYQKKYDSLIEKYEKIKKVDELQQKSLQARSG